MGEEFAGKPGGAGGRLGAGVAGDLAGGRGKGGGGVAAQEGGRDTVTGAEGSGEGFEVAVQDDGRDGRRVGGERADLGEPQVVGGAALRVPTDRVGREVGDGVVESGAAEGHGPQARGETLVRDGGGDAGLPGAQGGGDAAHADGQRVGLVNVRAGRSVCLGERGKVTVGVLPRAQGEEATEGTEGGEAGVEVHDVQ